jgi:choline dehydrogenase-like flavoprotein
VKHNFLYNFAYRSKIAKTFVKSAKTLGYSQIDLNDGQQVGISFLQQHTKKGWRVTSGKAYLEPVAFRKNLHVLTESQVTKVLLEKGNL